MTACGSQVQLNDGSQVLFERDDTNAPSDSKKGYRAWKRQDLEEQRRRQELTVNASVTGIGAGVNAHHVYTKAERVVQCNVRNVTASRMLVDIARVTDHLQSYTELLVSDWLFQPEARLSTQSDLAVAQAQVASISTVPSLLESSDATAFGFGQGSWASVPFHLKHNGPQFTVDLWVLLPRLPTKSVPLVRSLGPDGAGYALVLTAEGRCQFWLGLGLSTGVIQQTRFSVLDATCVAAGAKERLMHLAATFDGSQQRLYVDGLMSNSTAVLRAFVPNPVNALILGGSCTQSPACPEGSNGGNNTVSVADPVHASSPIESHAPFQSDESGVGDVGYTFQGVVDEVLLYSKALSSGGVRGHARSASQRLYARLKPEMSGFNGKCSGSCSLELSAKNTPNVYSISPNLGWSGTTVTISGRGFELQQDLPAVKIGTRFCSVVSRTNSSIECVIQGPTSPERLGPVTVAVEFSTFGRSADSLEFTLTSSIASISPSIGSTLGGTILTISAAGLPNVRSRVQVKVGEHRCLVSSVGNGVVRCALGMLREPSPATHSVTMEIDGVASICDGTCIWRTEPSATPSLQSAAPLVVSEGSVLTLQGDSLPAAVPVVKIGTSVCNVTSYGSDSVVCVVGKGHGGVHHLTVLYPQGFAKHAVEGCCPRITYSFQISAIVPTQGSRYGGQLVTIAGNGFSSASCVRVRIGGKESEIKQINSTSIIISTPRAGDAPRAGAEVHAWTELQLCNDYNTTATCEFGSYSLRGCQAVQTLLAAAGSSSPTGNAADVLAVAPPSDSLHVHERYLIDADPSTVWHSKNGASHLVIALDLKQARSIHGVSVHFAGQSSARQVRVSSGSSCDSFVQVLPWASLESNSSAWDQSATVDFAAHDARFVTVELEGLQAGMQDLRIRDLVIVEHAAQGEQLLGVSVRGEQAICAAGSCNFAFDMSPRVTGVEPSRGAAGTVLTISGDGFQTGDCASNLVSIGERICVAASCSATSLTCMVPEQAAGAYGISMTVVGVGKAHVLANLTFGQTLEIHQVTPSEVSFGGGRILTVKGSGFGDHEGHVNVKVCDSMCAVTWSNSSSLVCRQTAVADVASNVGSNTRTVQVSSPLDDAIEDENGVVIVDGSTMSFELPEYMRFPTDEIDARHAMDYPLSSLASHADAVRDAALEFWNREPSTLEVDTNVAKLDSGEHDIISMRKYFQTHTSNAYTHKRNNGIAWSRKTAFFRFNGLDIPAKAVVTEARLHVRAARACPKGTILRLWAEDADTSAGFDPSQQGSLGSRPRTRGINWQLEPAWKWIAEEHESVDIAPLINAVISRQGWRSHSSLTIIMQQAPPFADAVCSMLSTDYKAEYAPKLRLVLDANSTHAKHPVHDKPCSVSVSVEAPSDESTSCLRAALALSGAYAPSSVSSLHKQTYSKDSPVLTFSDAYEVGPSCAPAVLRWVCLTWIACMHLDVFFERRYVRHTGHVFVAKTRFSIRLHSWVGCSPSSGSRRATCR